jgi:hypothetical protein
MISISFLSGPSSIVSSVYTMKCDKILDPQLDQSSSGGYWALGLLTFRYKGKAK